MSARNLNAGDRVAIVGYRGDGIVRDVVVREMKDNRVIVFDRNRYATRSYLFEHIDDVRPVKQ